MNLGEKIEEHLEAIKDKDLINLIDDAFFKEELDRGVSFQVRRTNLLKDRRTLNVIDEIEEKEKMQRAFEEAEAKRDMTYEEYISKYGDMIEGKVNNNNTQERPVSTHSRPVTGQPDDDGKSEAGRSD